MGLEAFDSLLLEGARTSLCALGYISLGDER